MNPSSRQRIGSSRNRFGVAGRADGFTLIEVLISLIILSIGLLGLGLLQANSLKSSFSADQRTQASNLAYQMIDMMRANRDAAFEYTYITGEQATQDTTSCSTFVPQTAVPPPPPAPPDTVYNQDSFGWLCQVVRTLPGAVPTVTLGPPLPAGTAQVTIAWTDRGPTGASTITTFTVTSLL